MDFIQFCHCNWIDFQFQTIKTSPSHTTIDELISNFELSYICKTQCKFVKFAFKHYNPRVEEIRNLDNNFETKVISHI